jgi:hypothetical protein
VCADPGRQGGAGSVAQGDENSHVRSVLAVPPRADTILAELRVNANRIASPSRGLRAFSNLVVGFLREGVRVPEDVSVTGYDDSRIARMSFVNLTSVRQDLVEMGAAAVDAAIGMMSDPHTETQEQLIIPSLVVRGSTGPARPGARDPSSDAGSLLLGFVTTGGAGKSVGAAAGVLRSLMPARRRGRGRLPRIRPRRLRQRADTTGQRRRTSVIMAANLSTCSGCSTASSRPPGCPPKDRTVRRGQTMRRTENQMSLRGNVDLVTGPSGRIANRLSGCTYPDWRYTPRQTRPTDPGCSQHEERQVAYGPRSGCRPSEQAQVVAAISGRPGPPAAPWRLGLGDPVRGATVLEPARGVVSWDDRVWPTVRGRKFPQTSGCSRAEPPLHSGVFRSLQRPGMRLGRQYWHKAVGVTTLDSSLVTARLTGGVKAAILPGRRFVTEALLQLLRGRRHHPSGASPKEADEPGNDELTEDRRALYAAAHHPGAALSPKRPVWIVPMMTWILLMPLS